MVLPKLNIPLFDVIQPSSGKVIRCRPFLVEEEELLLIVQQGLSGTQEEQQGEIVDAICQILDNCILKPENLDVRSLPIFDIEYIFIQLRAKSIGDKIELSIKGIEDSECEVCKKPKNIEWDLSTIKVKKTEGHTNKIALTDDIGLIMKYPTIELMNELNEMRRSNNYLTVVAKCVDSIYEKDKIHKTADVDQEEVIAFLKRMTKKQSNLVKDFFDTQPKVSHDLTWTCPKCGHKQVYIVQGADNFFG